MVIKIIEGNYYDSDFEIKKDRLATPSDYHDNWFSVNCLRNYFN